MEREGERGRGRETEMEREGKRERGEREKARERGEKAREKGEKAREKGERPRGYWGKLHDNKECSCSPRCPSLTSTLSTLFATEQIVKGIPNANLQTPARKSEIMLVKSNMMRNSPMPHEQQQQQQQQQHHHTVPPAQTDGQLNAGMKDTIISFHFEQTSRTNTLDYNNGNRPLPPIPSDQSAAASSMLCVCLSVCVCVCVCVWECVCVCVCLRV
jgi:hypothetical protein